MSNKNNENSNSEIDDKEINSIIKKSSTLDAQSLYKILIKNPNLVNSTDDKKESILSLAIKNNNISVSNLILTSPILDLNYQDKDGNSYLHLAILYKQEDIVKSLIEKGIFLNKKNNKGNTALHLAYINYDKNIINILEENGIDTNIVNNNNKLAEDLKINLKQNKAIINSNIKEINKDNKIIDKIKENGDKNIKNNNLNLNNNKHVRIITQYQIKRIPNDITNKVNSLNNKNNNITNSININSKNKTNCSEIVTNKSKKSISSINQEPYDNYIIIANNDEYEKNMNINSDLTKNNNINKENDIFYDKENFKTFSAGSKKLENSKKKIEANKINNSNTNTNPTSPKIQKKNRLKKFLNNKNRNNNKNSCLGKPFGINNNIYINKDYSTQLELRHFNNSQEKLFMTKKELSASTKNINHFAESKLNNFIQKNEKKSKLSLTNKTYNKMSQIINQPNNENNINNEKESININNINNQALNLCSCNIEQKPIKINTNKDNTLLKEFLSQINLFKYFSNMDSNGFDDVNILIEEAKKGALIKDQELKEIGIKIPGDRAKIFIRIKEKANLFGFSVPKGVYHICENLEQMYEDKYISEMNNWLKTIKVDNYLINFVKSGYHSLELLLIQMETESPINQEILRDEIGIDIIGYRSRILNKLREDGKNMYNKLKTTTLVVNQNGNEKKCECFIF